MFSTTTNQPFPIGRREAFSPSKNSVLKHRPKTSCKTFDDASFFFSRGAKQTTIGYKTALILGDCDVLPQPFFGPVHRDGAREGRGKRGLFSPIAEMRGWKV